jgi:hypothetical protein
MGRRGWQVSGLCNAWGRNLRVFAAPHVRHYERQAEYSPVLQSVRQRVPRSHEQRRPPSSFAVALRVTGHYQVWLPA